MKPLKALHYAILLLMLVIGVWGYMHAKALHEQVQYYTDPLTGQPVPGEGYEDLATFILKLFTIEVPLFFLAVATDEKVLKIMSWAWTRRQEKDLLFAAGLLESSFFVVFLVMMVRFELHALQVLGVI